MNGHLIAVEIRVVRRANKWMNPNRVPFDQFWLEGLNRQAMQRRCTIQQDRMFPSHFIQRVPYNRLFFLNHLLGRADRMNLSKLLQTTNDKRFEQHESHLLRQSTLVKLELRPDHNYGSTRVINSLAQ